MKEAIDKLWRRVQLVVGLGRITTGDDSGAVQSLQIKLGQLEVRDATPRIAEYGFTSFPLPGCQGVMVFVGGDRSNGVIIATNDQTARLKNLKPGEVAIYDDQGQSIWLKRTGIEIDGAGLPILIHNTPSVTQNGGECNFNGVALNFNDCVSTHTGSSITSDGHVIDHNETHSGVVPGGANTGPTT